MMYPNLESLGNGRPFLLLHGGAGPFSVRGFGQRLADERPAQALVPTHPGFNGTPRLDRVRDVGTLADTYLDLLAARDLRDVVVVGNSIGGWIAAEMAARAAARTDHRLAGVVLMGASGLAVPEHPSADFFAMTFDELAKRSYHDPAKFRIDPSTLTDAQRAVFAGNREAIAFYTGAYAAGDPGLRARLASVTVPTLALWGEADAIVTPAYGRAYAAAIPGARFQLLTGTGHLPQLETPAAVLDAVWAFAEGLTRA